MHAVLFAAIKYLPLTNFFPKPMNNLNTNVLTPCSPDRTAESVLCESGAQRLTQNERSSVGQVQHIVIPF